MRVGYLSALDYTSRRSFSGIVHAMRRALAARPGVSVVDLGPSAEGGAGKRLIRRLGIGRDPADLTRREARERFAQQVTRQLRRSPVDVLFAPVASLELSVVPGDLPVVYASDATYRLLDPSYQLGDDPAEASLREESEVVAIRRATRLLYPSRWAAASAVEDYGASWDRIDLAPFGACFEDLPASGELAARRPPRPGDALRLLFVGRGYERKGGARALEAVRSLRARGVDAELTMIGSTPPEPAEGVTAVAYVDKEAPEQAAYLKGLYAEAHFLLFPTRADCSPITLCEAAAFGLPALAPDLAGIPDILEGWGVLLPYDAPGEDYADRVQELLADPEGYEARARAARRAYEERLNWTTWSRAAEASLRRAARRG